MPDQTRNLNSVTDFTGTLDSNDRIIMTDNKASLKALTTAILGKAMIEGYTGSSLAGSSQSVKSAIDGLNSKTQTYNYTASSGSFLDWVLSTFTTNGEYYVVYATTNYTGWAFSGTGTCLVQRRNSDYFLTAYVADTATQSNQSIHINRYTGGSWLGWAKVPTRNEVDALNSKRVYLNWGSTLTFTLPTGRQALVLIGNTEVHMLWNPTDSLNQNVVYAQGGQANTTISRGSSATEVVITRTANSTISVLIF